MNSEPSSWLGTMSKAGWTMLFVAVVAFVAWQLLKQLMVVLVLVVALLGMYRWIVRGRP